MASPAQITANQANAVLSTGPRTIEGKAAASRNSLSHGATSRQTVLGWESQSQFDSLAADTQAHYQPQGHHELALTTLVAVTFWRYNRLLRIEAEFMSAVDPGGAHPEAAVAALFADPAGARKLSLVLRYLANASREWRSAVTELRRIQKENRAATPDPFALDCNEEDRDETAELGSQETETSEPIQPSEAIHQWSDLTRAVRSHPPQPCSTSSYRTGTPQRRKAGPLRRRLRSIANWLRFVPGTQRRLKPAMPAARQPAYISKKHLG